MFYITNRGFPLIESHELTACEKISKTFPWRVYVK